MTTPGDASRELAGRLRSLRTSRWSRAINQRQLAAALSTRKPASISLVSSWEQKTAPALPPVDRLEAIATFFSTPRSIHGGHFQILAEKSLTRAESEQRAELLRELLALRAAAAAESSVRHGPWHFEGTDPVVIVCAELPSENPNHGPRDPDRSELADYADLDSLFELYGHLRAVNPDLRITRIRASRLRREDLTAHLVLLGGPDWNPATVDMVRLSEIPVDQFSSDDDPDRGYFRLSDEKFIPIFSQRGSDRILVQDVGQFLRTPNPLNQRTTVTVCNGMYAAGVFGAVCALTDGERGRANADFLAQRFPGHDKYHLLFKVHILNGVVGAPDWRNPETVLSTWPDPQDNRLR